MHALKKLWRPNLAIFCLLVLLAVSPLAAQPPAGYYDTVDATNDVTLRLTLHEVIDDHTWFPYTDATTDTWDIINLADEDPNNSGNILDLYKNASYAKIPGGVGAYNREHSWPKSYGFPTLQDFNYPYTDCHHLFAADGSYNSSRSNKPFRECNGGCQELTTDVNDGQGGGSGVYPGNSNWTSGSFTQGTWETWGGRKGDVARAMFYMDLRYEGGTHGITGHAEPDLIVTDNEALIDSGNTGSNEAVAYMGMLSVLLQWHQQDPPDLRELLRNEVVFSFQGNRNPFIDHPEWVDCLFNNVCSTDTDPPAAPTGLLATALNGGADVSWNANAEGDLAGYHVYRGTASGGPYVRVNVGLVAGTSFTNGGLTNGTTYFYVITAVDTSSNESASSAEASVTPDGSIPDITPPAAPTGLGATSGDTSIDLSWNASGEPDLAGYNLYRSTVSGGPYSQRNGTLLTGTTFQDTGLTNGTEYFYVLTAVDTSANESAASTEVSAIPQDPNALGVILSEVLYDVSSGDDGFEWVELYNGAGFTIDLSTFCLGNGGTDYTTSLVQLSGSVASGATFVVGGPSSSATNANPTFDQVFNFSPDFQNSGTAGDGVALFNVPCAQVNGTTVPVDAVVYGPNNDNGLIDESGTANAPEVGDAGPGSSIERIDLAGNWQIQGNPTPNAASFAQPPGNTAPAVAITAPSDGATFPDGTNIAFTGVATDAEDGDLSAALVWTSDLDGVIGNGASFGAVLSPGTHFITAEVTDSGGLVGGADIFVTVTPPGPAGGNLILSEVFYDPSGTDDGLEWIELYNADTVAIDLSGFSIGSGGVSYTGNLVQLAGVIQPGETFVFGGPTSNATNFNPTFDATVNFTPDLENSGTAGDGIALYNVPAAQVTGSTIPIDAVVYGPNNNNGLIDETGAVSAPEVVDAPSGSSIERIDLAGNWQVQGTPTPNTTPLNGPPPPGPNTVTFTAVAAEDGWVRESNEGSNSGSTTSSSDSSTDALRAGDDRRDRQYKSVVSFDTASLPDGAIITSVTLRLRRGTVVGTNPFNTHGACWVDVQNGGLNGSTSLESGDFEAAATAPKSATLSNASADGDWSEASLDASGLAAVSKTGTTQLRFYFDLDDNDDRSNDYIGYFGADDANGANHPELVVTYQ